MIANQRISQIAPPSYERVAYDFQGKSWRGQLWAGLTTPPRVRLLEDWIVIMPGGLRVIVPRGFVTDGASIPRPLWGLLSPFGVLLEGALLHDFGYQYGYLLAPYRIDQAWNIASLRLRAEYAAIYGPYIPVYVGKPQRFFDDLLQAVTVDITGASAQAWSARQALRLFGMLAWARYRSCGPAAITPNSLHIPGVDSTGLAIA